jgi:hypothetical protein
MWKVLCNAALSMGAGLAIILLISLVMTQVFHIRPISLVKKFIGGGF